MSPTLKTLLSPHEVAEYLSVPLQTVYSWRTKRTGPTAIKVGRHLRYRLGDVEKWLSSHEGTAS